MSLCHFQQIFRPVEVMVRNIPSCSLVKVGAPKWPNDFNASHAFLAFLATSLGLFMAEIDELFKVLFVDVKILNGALHEAKSKDSSDSRVRVESTITISPGYNCEEFLGDVVVPNFDEKFVRC